MSAELQEIFALLSDKQHIIVLTHNNPDADAVGAMATISLILQEQGKEVLALYSGILHESLNSFSPIAFLTTTWADNFTPDAVIVLDTSMLSDLGNHIEARLRLFKDVLWINIDHHTSNSQFGILNIVDLQASSTCEIIARLLMDSSYDVSPKIATFLLTGIVSDTGRFFYTNTQPTTLQIAATLMKAGADLAQINQELKLKIPLSGIHLWGNVMKNARQTVSGKVVWSTITSNMFTHIEEVRLIGREMISLLQRTEDSELAIGFVEAQADLTLVSLRSRGNVDCAAIAEHFGVEDIQGQQVVRFKVL